MGPQGIIHPRAGSWSARPRVATQGNTYLQDRREEVVSPYFTGERDPLFQKGMLKPTGTWQIQGADTWRVCCPTASLMAFVGKSWRSLWLKLYLRLESTRIALSVIDIT